MGLTTVQRDCAACDVEDFYFLFDGLPYVIASVCIFHQCDLLLHFPLLHFLLPHFQRPRWQMVRGEIKASMHSTITKNGYYIVLINIT